MQTFKWIIYQLLLIVHCNEVTISQPPRVSWSSQSSSYFSRVREGAASRSGQGMMGGHFLLFVGLQGVPKNALIEQNHNQNWVLWGWILPWTWLGSSWSWPVLVRNDQKKHQHSISTFFWDTLYIVDIFRKEGVSLLATIRKEGFFDLKHFPSKWPNISITTKFRL